MQCTPARLRRRRRGGRGGLSRTWRPRAQALREGRLRGAALAPDERMRRPGLGTLVLDEADLMLAMPGYAADLAALAPLVRPPRARMHPALPCKGPAAQLAAAHLAVLAPPGAACTPELQRYRELWSAPPQRARGRGRGRRGAGRQ